MFTYFIKLGAMEKVILNVKDKSQLQKLFDAIKKFDFVEVWSAPNKPTVSKNHDIFESAGMWKDREINVQALRKEARKRNH